MKAGSLFTGTAALDMAAAEVFGAETAWFSDIDPGSRALLAHHYPDVPNIGEISEVNWSAVEPVEILTGGFPCQDISHAGKREGITGARSGLWSYYADAIRVLRPRYVLIENVGALVVRGLDRVLADLAALGLDAAWTAVRASDVGAPHRRERIFILAAEDPDGAAGGERRLAASGEAEGGRARADARGRGRAPAADSGRDARPEDDTNRPAAADADSDGVREQPIPVTGRRGEAVVEQPGAHAATDADGGGRVLDWAGYTPAIRRWEAVTERLAPVPTVPGARGGRVLNPALPEWMMGLPDGWITAVPGLSRSAQLKLAGNGVVPQQAVAAYRYLLDVLECDAERAA